MLDFKIYSNTRFQIGNSVYPRLYRVFKGSAGISLIHIFSGKRLRENMDESEILIEGLPLVFLSDLQKIVYNTECLCEDGEDTDEPKIFDLHFDKTFE